MRLRNMLEVWFTAILTYLPVLPFQIIIASNARFKPMSFTVPMWGSEIAEVCSISAPNYDEPKAPLS